MTSSPPLLEFTANSAAEAVRLYFAPVRRIFALLAQDREPVAAQRLRRLEEEQKILMARLNTLDEQINSPFDSLTDMGLRVNRLKSWLGRQPADAVPLHLRTAIQEIDKTLQEALLETNGRESLLVGLRPELRIVEAALGFEKHLYSQPIHRRAGASGGD